MTSARMLPILRALHLADALGPSGGVSMACTPLGGGDPMIVDINACIDRVLNAETRNSAADDDIGVNHDDRVSADSVARRVSDVLGAYGGPPMDAGRVRARIKDRRTARQRLQALLQSGRGVPQRTAEWHAARQDMITASDIAQALGCGKFGTQRQFFEKKCQPPSASGGDDASWAAKSAAVPSLKWGVMFEPVAAGLYAAQNGGVRLHEFGLLRHSTIPFLGASPDGITDAGVMVEIKCPWKRRIDGEVLVQYYLQIQGQLAVCGLTECDFYECEFDKVESPLLVRDAGGADGQWDAAPPTARGLILELPTVDGGATYEYPMDGAMPAEGWRSAAALDAWARERVAAWEQTPDRLCSVILGPRLHWWVLRRAASQRVRFDPEVWAAALAQLQDVWARVLRYRACPAQYDLEVLGSQAPPISGVQQVFVPQEDGGISLAVAPVPPPYKRRASQSAPADQELRTYAFIEDDE